MFSLKIRVQFHFSHSILCNLFIVKLKLDKSLANLEQFPKIFYLQSVYTNVIYTIPTGFVQLIRSQA